MRRDERRGSGTNSVIMEVKMFEPGLCATHDLQIRRSDDDSYLLLSQALNLFFLPSSSFTIHSFTRHPSASFNDQVDLNLQIHLSLFSHV